MTLFIKSVWFSFSILADEISDKASGLIVNRLGVSTDVLLPTSCDAPPDVITPAETSKTFRLELVFFCKIAVSLYSKQKLSSA